MVSRSFAANRGRLALSGIEIGSVTPSLVMGFRDMPGDSVT
jgi:hypothetical protein